MAVGIPAAGESSRIREVSGSPAAGGRYSGIGRMGGVRRRRRPAACWGRFSPVVCTGWDLSPRA